MQNVSGNQRFIWSLKKGYPSEPRTNYGTEADQMRLSWLASNWQYTTITLQNQQSLYNIITVYIVFGRTKYVSRVRDTVLVHPWPHSIIFSWICKQFFITMTNLFVWIHAHITYTCNNNTHSIQTASTSWCFIFDDNYTSSRSDSTHKARVSYFKCPQLISWRWKYMKLTLVLE